MEGRTAFGRELILRGAEERLAPILMTALVTALALLPVVLSGGRAGHEIEHPMAVVILGGLMTSTALNLLLFLPCTSAGAAVPRQRPFNANVTLTSFHDHIASLL